LPVSVADIQRASSVNIKINTMIQELTLLEKAKNVNVKGYRLSITDEEYELCLAHIRGEITQTQMQLAIGKKSTAYTYTLLSRAFKRYFFETQTKTQ